MSIATEITRLQNAKASIKTSIENKGVTVGDITLDEYASKIDDIQAGTDISEYFANQASSSAISQILKKLPQCTFTSTSIYGLEASNNLQEVEDLTILNATTIQSAFASCSNLKKVKLTTSSSLKRAGMAFQYCSLLEDINLFNTENVIDTNSMFRGCGKLKVLPAFNTGKSTDFTRFCYGCEELVDVPQLNLAKATSLNFMFDGCGKLSDESLNNILASCVTATSFTGNKTLATLGFTRTAYPVSKIQGLSNYSAFINAGWSIGYN